MIDYSSYLFFAQSAAESAGDAAKETADQTRELLTKITTGKIIQALIIILFCFTALKVIEWSINWVSERIARERRLRVKQLLPLLRTIVLTATIVTLMNLFLNLSRENLLAVTGTVAVALGFAFKDYASSIIAGIVGIFEGSYRVGDRVQIGDDYGEVVSYGLRGIRLQTPGDNTVTIPHNKIWTESVSNSNAGELEAQVITEFFFAHEVNTELVTKILYRAAHVSRYTQLELPIAVVMAETPSGTHFKLKSYPLDARDEFIYQTDLTNKAKRIFAKHNLAYPRLANIEQE